MNFAIKLSNSILKEKGLTDWKTVLNNSKSCFGLCNYHLKQIQLSRYYLPHMTETAIFDLIVHEIAHALTPGDGHGRNWKRLCIEMGGTGERTNNVSNVIKTGAKLQSKYSAICPDCGYTTSLHRKPKRNQSCGICCPSYYNSEFKLKIIQNY